MKYLKYYISTFTLALAIYVCQMGGSWPSLFFIGFSLFIILGDWLIVKDRSEQKYSNIFLLNLPMYLNLPALVILVLLASYMISEETPTLITLLLNKYFSVSIDRIHSLTTMSSVSLIALTGLFIGIMGTVPGHELIHRKKNKFDMFIGNWLLAISWDCAFAIEHVYGHHKNVGLDIDPATAKRGENIYLFILKAIWREQRDAWRISKEQMVKKGQKDYIINNTMILGYLRSLVITSLAYLIGGLSGALVYLLCAFIAKSLLEVINYTEHYGLVRVFGEPVKPKHSWNSNSVLSSIYLYNVTRHSSHHEKANLKYWELKPYGDAPMMPEGYLSMLYMALFLPFFFHRVMSKKLINWDQNYASEQERRLAMQQNNNSGIPLLEDTNY